MHMVKCILWDEIVPQHHYTVEALDCSLHDLRDNDRPFSGITLIASGDFKKTLPVIPKGSCEQILDATVTRSYLWNDVELIHLHQNMQLQNDSEAEEFQEWLLQIGHGRNSDENSKVTIPQEIRSNNIEYLMNFIYLNLASVPSPPPEYFLN